MLPPYSTSFAAPPCNPRNQLSARLPLLRDTYSRLRRADLAIAHGQFTSTVALANRSVQGYRLSPRRERCVNRPPSPPGARCRPNRANADHIEVEAIHISPVVPLRVAGTTPVYIHPQILPFPPPLYFCCLPADYPAILLVVAFK